MDQNNLLAQNSTEGSHSEFGAAELRAVEEDASLHVYTEATPDPRDALSGPGFGGSAMGGGELPTLGAHLLENPELHALMTKKLEKTARSTARNKMNKTQQSKKESFRRTIEDDDNQSNFVYGGPGQKKYLKN
jgi:hypothetical protein